MKYKYGIAIALGAGIYEDGVPQPHTANRIKKCAELVQSGLADILVTTGRNSAQAMKNYAVKELGIEEQRVWTEPTTWSFINESKIARTNTVPKFLEYVGHIDLQDFMIHFAMQEWAFERLEKNVKKYFRYNYSLTNLGHILPYTIHTVEDGRSEEVIKGNKQSEGTKEKIDEFIREMPLSIYLGDWYQIPFILLSKIISG